jgi:hypothetical protein
VLAVGQWHTRAKQKGERLDHAREATVVASTIVEPKEASPTSGLFRSFSELATLAPEPDWLWDGYLARGQVTMIAGRDFVGKSLLVGSLMKAIENETPFLGRPTSEGTALLVSEEDESVMRARAEKFGLLELRSDFASRNSGTLRMSWPELVAAATERAVERSHGLLVFDTFAGLAGLVGEDENHAGAVMERLSPLLAAAGEGLAVLFLHHVNGYGESRGSKAFRTAVDIKVHLHRHARRPQFRLDAEGRVPGATPEVLHGVLKQQGSGWLYEPAKSPGREREKHESTESENTDDRLWAALLDGLPSGLTYADFDDYAGLSRDIAARRLPQWDPERVTRSGSGKKGDPFRWFPRT